MRFVSSNCVDLWLDTRVPALGVNPLVVDTYTSVVSHNLNGLVNTYDDALESTDCPNSDRSFNGDGIPVLWISPWYEVEPYNAKIALDVQLPPL